ncbi:hypothetical protein [Streptomyces tibetensis]|uniref:hypothetical protein n=1 Tax=Streptomyces tibetensis TaxID=2382123 RepID=UPI00340B19C1
MCQQRVKKFRAFDPHEVRYSRAIERRMPAACHSFRKMFRHIGAAGLAAALA